MGIPIERFRKEDPAKQPGGAPSGIPPGQVGTWSPFEKLLKSPSDTSSRTPLHGILMYFERHHNGVPAIAPTKYELLIHGMVDKPLILTLADLKRFSMVSRIALLEYSGNFRMGKETLSPQAICGLTSQSEWTGVSPATLFREVGVKSGVSWFLAEGGDAAPMTRSIPVQKGWDDAIIAYAQNGEALRPEQGYPVRLFLSGWEGNTIVKWLRRLELSDQSYRTREETSKHTEATGDGKIR